MTYQAPIAEMRFALDAVAGLPKIARLPGYEEATPDLVSAILEEAGKLAADVLAPLNHPGDRQGSVFENGVVRTPEGFQDAYAQFVAGGWRSEEHTSELQSLMRISYAVFCLKKKQKNTHN